MWSGMQIECFTGESEKKMFIYQSGLIGIKLF